MIYDYHIVLAALGVIVGLAGYFVYYRDIIRGTTKPHVFTWFAWGLINCVAFVAQVTSGAGVGAAVTGLTTFACFGISFAALFQGKKDIRVVDWFCFIGALLGVVLWVITKEALTAVVIISLTDALAYAPAYRKAFHKPNEETALSYGIAVFRSLFGIAALQSFVVVNWLYPASLVLTDGAFTTMLLIRRRQLAKRAAGDTPREIRA